MSEEKFCYIHKNQPTRLTCSSCDKPICPKCIVNSPVGYKCKECGKPQNHLITITTSQYIYALLSGLAIGILAGFIWNYFKGYGFFISSLTAYAVGFCIAKTITKIIGHKLNKNLKILVAVITIISMVYNPVIIILNLATMPLLSGIMLITLLDFANIVNIFAIIIAIWASIRHLDF